MRKLLLTLAALLWLPLHAATAQSTVRIGDASGHLAAVSAAGALSVIDANAITTVPIPTTGNIGSDCSTTLTLGGTAQSACSGATPLNGITFCNPDASEIAWVSFSTTAAANNTGSIPLQALQCMDSGGMLPWQALSWVAVTTGHKMTIYKR